jgi:hypothetical protein
MDTNWKCRDRRGRATKLVVNEGGPESRHGTFVGVTREEGGACAAIDIIDVLHDDL